MSSEADKVQPSESAASFLHVIQEVWLLCVRDAIVSCVLLHCPLYSQLRYSLLLKMLRPLMAGHEENKLERSWKKN